MSPFSSFLILQQINLTEATHVSKMDYVRHFWNLKCHSHLTLSPVRQFVMNDLGNQNVRRSRGIKWHNVRNRFLENRSDVASLI